VRLLALLAVLLAGAHPWAAAAQTMGDCDRFEANARNTFGPYEQTIREFANGAIRVIALDVGEPAAGGFHVLLTHPAPDDPYGLCTLVSDETGLGFSGLDMAALTAVYDPARGLTISLPVQRLIGGETLVSATLNLTVNQATGRVTADLLSLVEVGQAGDGK